MASRKRGFMFAESVSFHLTPELEEGGARVHKQKSTVLFRRGEKAAGMYVVQSGKVTLDYGVDSVVASSETWPPFVFNRDSEGRRSQKITQRKRGCSTESGHCDTKGDPV